MSTLRDILSNGDYALAVSYLGQDREPDFTIGEPSYLHRWHVIPRNESANVYMHVQVASDPDRPLHDHPWDNQSVILAGGYDEIIGRRNLDSPSGSYSEWEPLLEDRLPRGVGGVFWRRAEQPHRLILPRQTPYTMTLFTTGPVKRNWGFWTQHGWKPHEECVIRDPETGASIWNPSIPRERI